MNTVWLMHIDGGDIHIFAELTAVRESLDLTYSKLFDRPVLAWRDDTHYNIMLNNVTIGTVELVPLHSEPTHL